MPASPPRQPRPGGPGQGPAHTGGSPGRGRAGRWSAAPALPAARQPRASAAPARRGAPAERPGGAGRSGSTGPGPGSCGRGRGRAGGRGLAARPPGPRPSPRPRARRSRGRPAARSRDLTALVLCPGDLVAVVAQVGQRLVAVALLVLPGRVVQPAELAAVVVAGVLVAAAGHLGVEAATLGQAEPAELAGHPRLGRVLVGELLRLGERGVVHAGVVAVAVADLGLVGGLSELGVVGGGGHQPAAPTGSAPGSSTSATRSPSARPSSRRCTAARRSRCSGPSSQPARTAGTSKV